MTRYGPLAFAVALIAVIPACHRTIKPASYVPASGTMALPNNTPVSYAKLLFWPERDGARFPTIPYCITGKDGKFVVRMDADQPGLPPGRYKVSITLSKSSKLKLPTSYADPNTTPLDVVIPETGSTDLKIRVE